jgi:hypothetical protein
MMMITGVLFAFKTEELSPDNDTLPHSARQEIVTIVNSLLLVTMHMFTAGSSIYIKTRQVQYKHIRLH